MQKTVKENSRMKAVRLVEIHRPLQMQDISVPTIGDDDVLVRVRAAGICHTDVHYRAGKSPVQPLPRTLGHEVAGVVEQVGKQVTAVKVGNHVCLHYVLSCGNCFYCSAGNEQFCVRGSMVGRYADGGYGEYVAVPERNALHLPDEIPFEHGTPYASRGSRVVRPSPFLAWADWAYRQFSWRMPLAHSMYTP